MLGRPGEEVTMLGLGGWHIGHMSESDAEKTIEVALEGGVRFFDSAESYQEGGSESYLGRFLVPKYRDVSFLMTKTTAGDAATARRHLEESLQRLRTDYLDLWQVHSLRSPDDVDDRIENGVLDVVIEAREKGKARHVGFTGHASPKAHLRMLERTDLFETCQMPINALDPGFESFVDQVLPVLVERNLGVIAMKTLANGRFFQTIARNDPTVATSVIPGRISVADALSFVWSLPVSVLVTGPDDPSQLSEKIEMARSFTKLTDSERRTLVGRVADLAGREIEYYKS
jgi:predicted aldo/keto reductase-like oxidoreductase